MASAAPPATFPANDRVVLYNVSWETYTTLRKNLGESPIRLTYDGNNLEIMSPSRWHEHAKKILGRMVEILTLELNIPVSSGGSMTFQRADLERGLEPDECYWIANESAVREKRELDLTIDPPPDLAIEVDISPSRLDRPRIYSKLQVPEIWRYDGHEVHVELLLSDGTYQPAEASLSFAFLQMRELPRFLAIAEHEGETQGLRAFVQWLREQDFSA
jgi:Uma2 family endonuclease